MGALSFCSPLRRRPLAHYKHYPLLLLLTLVKNKVVVDKINDDHPRYTWITDEPPCWNKEKQLIHSTTATIPRVESDALFRD